MTPHEPSKAFTEEQRAELARHLDRARGRDFLATCTTRSQLLAGVSVIGFTSHAYGHSR
jgi:acetyl-CoA carboxylase alpha subunit